MSDIKLISPLLDNLDIGDRISGHDGVHCYPAMIRGTNEKYIVKVISIPASQTQLDALLLTGAYASEEDALQYFQDLATGLEEELQLLQRLSKLEGFISYENWQTMQKEVSAGYDIYLLGAYRKTLQEHFERNPMTHLGAVNLGLDLCAALAVCRRAGYLYVDLKPSNIYILHDKEYKIGDLGFVRLDSLKYASLPDKYRSAYTAPEIQDAFSSLNTTLDIYAVGLILYQAYNNGTLPVMQENGVLPPPDYADYEMADIILKACATDPGSRWQDPLEMGQALISYMQRNSVNDTPIVPVAVSEESLEPMPQDLDAAEAQSDRVAEFASEANDHSEEEINDTVPDTQCDQATDQEAQSPIVATPSAPDSDGIFAYTEDDFGNLSFLLDKEDETDPSSLSEEMDYQDLSAEVSEILAQADELADHPVPEPVVAPEPVDITIPEPIVTDADSEDVDNPAQPDEVTEDNDEDQDPSEAVEITKQHEDVAAQEDETPPKKKFRGLAAILIALALLALGTACFLYYQYFYLMPINAITLDGNQDTLVVAVDSKVDETLLKVICSDSHGNQITMPVVDGKATFKNLVPNTAYNVKLVVVGFHKLTGDTATAYSTPAQTNIVQFSAVAGAEDGSAILGFTVDGPDATQWSVTYSAEGEAAKTVTFPTHMVTISGLTVGKTYTFTLSPDTDLYVTGTTELTFTGSKLVCAQNLRVISLIDGTLTAVWDSPSDVNVTNWTVRCYNDSDYNETVITAETTAVFENLDQDSDYTLEVTAAGMSVSQRVYVAKNSFTVANFQANVTDGNKLAVLWETAQQIPDGGWVLNYTIDDMDKQQSVVCSENHAELSNALPGATYIFTLQGSDGTVALAEPFVYHVPEAPSFNGYNVSASDMSFRLYKAPGVVYTNNFKSTDSIYMLIDLHKRTTSSADSITILYVIRDSQGNVISYDSTKLLWKNMWSGNDCILAIPYTPEQAGDYTLSVYFNGASITEQAITVRSAAE